MELRINGKGYTVNCDPSEMLVWVLRDDLGLTGTKMGCGAGICGSCTIHIAGVPVRSCVTPVSAAIGQELTTIEGLATILDDGTEQLHPVQQAFLDEQVPQCAWCMSGQIMTAAAFLKENAHPNADDIDNALANNYCRCGCYVRIRTAVEKAALVMNAQT